MLTQCCLSCGSSDKQTNRNYSNFSKSELSQTKIDKNTDKFIVQKNHEAEIISFFKFKDYNHINSFIDKEMKLTILFSIGVNPIYVKIDSLAENYEYYLNKRIPSWIAEGILYNFQNAFIDALKHTNKPIFECEKILQRGAFIDKGENIKIMTKSIENLIYVEKLHYQDSEYLTELKNEYNYYDEIESKSIRVVITKKSKSQIMGDIKVFHFTEKNGKLYLTLLDFESFRCSV